MKRSAESGSSPLELVSFTTLLLMPLGLGLSTYQQLSNELAAESIARHALRLAMLQNPARPSEALPQAVEQFAGDWELSELNYRYWCSANCSLVTLEITVERARAIQTMGIPKL
jgi:hypothetical protein